jgi:Xaa-Pro aminopeptidase
VDISELVHRLRGAKSPWEQARIGESADLCLKTLTHLQTLAFPGMSETELAGLAEVFARDHGHGGGIRVRSPFQDSRSCRLSDGACEVPANGPFSLGFNAVVNGYHASRARIFTPPALSDAQQRDIQALESLHARILRRAGSATSLNSVQQAADMETARSVKTCPSLEVRFSFHGIGLELREPVAPDQDTGDWKERTLCLAVETSGRSPQGPPLFLQDTVTLDGTGLRLL